MKRFFALPSMVIVALAMLAQGANGLAKSCQSQYAKHPQTVSIVSQKERHEVAFSFKPIATADQMLMTMQGKVNGRNHDLVFDTGAAFNVISAEVAAACQIEMLRDTAFVQGIGNTKGRTGVARRLSIGSIELRNVPFLVLDTERQAEIHGQQSATLPVIIGQPILKLFGKYTIDCRQNKVFFSRTAPRRQVESNLVWTKSGVMQVKVEKDGQTFYLTQDTGATNSSMGPDYYKAFQAEIARLGKWDIDKQSGVGGSVYNSVFRLPSITLKVGGKTVSLSNIPVTALSSHQNAISSGFGRLGIDFFKQAQRVEIDNVNMMLSIE